MHRDHLAPRSPLFREAQIGYAQGVTPAFESQLMDTHPDHPMCLREVEAPGPTLLEQNAAASEMRDGHGRATVSAEAPRNRVQSLALVPFAPPRPAPRSAQPLSAQSLSRHLQQKTGQLATEQAQNVRLEAQVQMMEKLETDDAAPRG